MPQPLFFRSICPPGTYSLSEGTTCISVSHTRYMSLSLRLSIPYLHRACPFHEFYLLTRACKSLPLLHMPCLHMPLP